MKNLFQLSLMISFLAVMQVSAAPFSGGCNYNSTESAQRGNTMDFVESAGIIYYDMNEVIEKTKVKDETVKEKMMAAFACYEDSLQRLSFTHAENLMSLRAATDNYQSYMESKDKAKIRGVFLEVQSSILKLRPITQRYEDELCDSLRAILSKKEMKNWDRFLKKTKKEKCPPMGRRH